MLGFLQSHAYCWKIEWSPLLTCMTDVWIKRASKGRLFIMLPVEVYRSSNSALLRYSPIVTSESPLLSASSVVVELSTSGRHIVQPASSFPVSAWLEPQAWIAAPMWDHPDIQRSANWWVSIGATSNFSAGIDGYRPPTAAIPQLKTEVGLKPMPAPPDVFLQCSHWYWWAISSGMIE